jgi:hypothetical protein
MLEPAGEHLAAVASLRALSYDAPEAAQEVSREA